jgi:hypothetical protein
MCSLKASHCFEVIEFGQLSSITKATSVGRSQIGEYDGERVGDLVGLSVGDSVGLFDGDFVGDRVG